MIQDRAGGINLFEIGPGQSYSCQMAAGQIRTAQICFAQIEQAMLDVPPMRLASAKDSQNGLNVGCRTHWPGFGTALSGRQGRVFADIGRQDLHDRPVLALGVVEQSLKSVDATQA